MRGLPLLLALGACAKPGVKVELVHEGLPREAYVHVAPNTPDDARPPLVINVHGYVSNAAQQQAYLRLHKHTDPRGWMTVHPEGLPDRKGRQAWNGGDCCGEVTTNDLGFLNALLDEVEAVHPFDRSRVYYLGLSNGGILGLRGACEEALPVAAYGITIALRTVPIDACSATAPVRMLRLNSTADPIVPYTGFAYDDLTSDGVLAQTRAFADLHGLTEGTRELLQQGAVRCQRYLGPADNESALVLCTVEGAGHTVPGAPWVPWLGPVNRDVDGTELILDFFAGELPGAP